MPNFTFNFASEFLRKNCSNYYKISPIICDASNRKYYRVFLTNGETLILMDAPPSLEKLDEFLKVDRFLLKNGFRAPEVFAYDLKDGFALIEDFGDLIYKKAIENANIDEEALYLKAIDVLVNLHQIKISQEEFKPYSNKILLDEVALYHDWYLKYIIKKELNQDDFANFTKIWKNLLKKTVKNNKVLTLRDYHAQNLFFLNDGSVGLIDFQDALFGNYAYDLVSILEDARRDVDKKVAETCFNYYLKQMSDKLPNFNEEHFIRDYKILSLQRNLKIIGIFARLSKRDGKGEYLEYLPRMFKYVRYRLKDKLFSDLSKFITL